MNSSYQMLRATYHHNSWHNGLESKRKEKLLTLKAEKKEFDKMWNKPFDYMKKAYSKARTKPQVSLLILKFFLLKFPHVLLSLETAEKDEQFFKGVQPIKQTNGSVLKEGEQGWLELQTPKMESEEI